MFIDHCSHVVHAAIADLYAVVIEYLVLAVARRKSPINNLEEQLADIGAHVFAERWSEP